MDDIQALVLDIGASVKAGFAGDLEPRAEFPTVVGRPRNRGVMVGMGRKDSYVGDEALSKRAILTLKCPIERGVVTNLDDYEKVLHQTFYNELRVAPEEHSVLLAVSAVSSAAERSKVTQIMFETFNVPAFYRASSAELVLLAAGGGRTGLVLECGEYLTAAVPVVDGKALHYAVETAPFGGGDVTRALEAVLGLQRPGMGREIKEKYAFVASDVLRQDMQPLVHTLDSGETITMRRETFTCSELLFSHGAGQMKWEVARVLLLGRRERDCPLAALPRDVFLLIVRRVGRRGWTDLAEAALERSPAELRGVLRGHVVLTGGGTLLRGAAERLARELRGATVVAEPGRARLAWRGGSLLAAQPDLPWLTVEEYNEHGPDTCWEKKASK